MLTATKGLMRDQVMTLTILAVLLTGVIFRYWLKPKIKGVNRWLSCLIRSLFYSLFFGIGALGAGGGEPGFILPAPTLAAAILDSRNLISNAIIPLLFWWAVFLIILILKEVIIIFRSRSSLV